LADEYDLLESLALEEFVDRFAVSFPLPNHAKALKETPGIDPYQWPF